VSAAEADLERLLSIEPSVEFRARVRERVASESIRGHRWPSSWVLVRAGVLIALGFALLIPSPDVDRPSPPDAPRVFQTAVYRPDTIPVLVQATPIATVQGARPRVAPRDVREPEVVWDARGAAALEQLVELARSGTVVSAPPASKKTLEVEPLIIPPITTDSLVLSTGSERSSS
jgi:hypothetical protein